MLQRVLGYHEVRGAYYAATPGAEPHRHRLAIAGQPDFALDVDVFDAGRHAFPYKNAAFDVVLCAELIEHLTHDPMHMLLECHRVLAEDGLLVLTTPNAASLHAVAATLHGRRNPQVFSAYPDPAGDPDVPHVREYTAHELGAAVTAAGFAVEALFTEPLAGFENSRWAGELLAREGFDTALRGEQTYCLARKQSGLPQDRYTSWLYARG
ncbi:MAG: methyltransferase domain-containing protein [Bryobacterales bacterium]|nr:methyltransferase domain-containing protein [Bryobacterales bacterium]